MCAPPQRQELGAGYDRCQIGVGARLFGARLIESHLWGVSGRDPAIYAAATAARLLVVFVASTWPARSATRVEPVEALRVD